MKDLTTAAGVIELVSNADRPVGRKIITLGEMVELQFMAENEKTACSEQTALRKTFWMLVVYHASIGRTSF
ncbi:hypothetical protein [Brevibacillus choshinensis]|uniref:Uncharacterized protein n=1 Tax=Brevibacillus choshinensis TaxID=54911 RepID=A0ABX7FHE5_BRECH|nr:hypothetical protein [Brevibacillus choshinensis]QRG65280.1 hypothetical protein JNE38_16710 [Brevibacillus choshinensis]